MNRKCLLVSIVVLAFLFVTCGRAAAQRWAPLMGNTANEYDVIIPFPDGERLSFITLYRLPLVLLSEEGREMRGWIMNGWCLRGDNVYYVLFGTSVEIGPSGADWWRMKLTMKLRDSSIVGYLEGRFTDDDTLRMQWRPSGPGSVPIACTLVRRQGFHGRFIGCFDLNFISFWDRFRDALRRNDSEAVADMTAYPLGSVMSCLPLDPSAGNAAGYSRFRFVQYFSKIFHSRARKDLLGVDAVEMIVRPYMPSYSLMIPNLNEKDILYYYTRQSDTPQSDNRLVKYYFAQVQGTYKFVYCDCETLKGIIDR